MIFAPFFVKIFVSAGLKNDELIVDDESKVKSADNTNSPARIKADQIEEKIRENILTYLHLIHNSFYFLSLTFKMRKNLLHFSKLI